MPNTDAQSLTEVRTEALTCTRCPLYLQATQTVFGEGAPTARIMLVGEQPGDREDVVGRPFVGPAGNVLDRALAAAELSRSDCYVTNAVKHFKFEERGKRRLHKRPGAYEIDRCRFWLEREIALISPRLIVALGVTAASALLKRTVSIRSTRGKLQDFLGRPGLVTIHPSYVLRIRDEADADREFAAFVADLARSRTFVAGKAARPIDAGR